MSDELLSRATRALRASTKPHREGMQEMLVRVSRPRAGFIAARPRLRAVAYALAATLVGVGAWARVTGRLEGILAVAATESSPPPASAVVSRTRPGPPLPKAASNNEARPPLAEAVPSVESARPPASEPRRAGRKVARDPTPPAVSGKSRPSPSSSSGAATANVDQLYREAHHAHFAGGDASAAVAAWDKYLAAAGPDARMLIEARYNRATALVRLGRVDEALSALRPFADGSYGNYRREEARALTASLSARAR